MCQNVEISKYEKLDSFLCIRKQDSSKMLTHFKVSFKLIISLAGYLFLCCAELESVNPYRQNFP